MPELNVVKNLSAFKKNLFELLEHLFALIALEYRLAKISFLIIIGLLTTAIVFILSMWLCLLFAFYMRLIQIFNPYFSLFFIASLNALLAVFCLIASKYFAKNLSFSSTKRQLNLTKDVL